MGVDECRGRGGGKEGSLAASADALALSLGFVNLDDINLPLTVSPVKWCMLRSDTLISLSLVDLSSSLAWSISRWNSRKPSLRPSTGSTWRSMKRPSLVMVDVSSKLDASVSGLGCMYILEEAGTIGNI